jgi:hypothetical protein
MNRKKNLKKCFIVASSGLNIQPLKNLLKGRNIEVYDIISTPLTGISISSLVKKMINNSDFVIAIISLKDPRPNVFFELGLAYGAKKPVFLIIQDEGFIPMDIKDMVYIRTSIDNLEIISSTLDQFLSKHEYPIKKYKFRIARTRIERQPKEKSSVEFLQRDLENIAKQGNVIEFESFLANLLKTEGVLTQSREVKGADMALWIDDLESSLGNPILVEVKMGKISESSLLQAEEQLRNYLLKTNTRAGLLIYLDREEKHFKRSKFRIPLIIRLEAHELISELSDRSLALIILSERNQMAHFGE